MIKYVVVCAHPVLTHPNSFTLMPHVSTQQELLSELHYVALHVLEAREQAWNVADDDDNFDLLEDVDEDDDLEPIIITPLSPISPVIFLDILNSDSEFDQLDGGR